MGKITVKRRVWIGLIFVLSVTGAWWGWTKAKPPSVAIAAPPQQPFVRLTPVGPGTNDRILRERADLFDPTPLFFPTEWNFGQSPLRDSIRRQPGQAFGSFEPKLTFAEQNMKSYGNEESVVLQNLPDVLAQGNEAPFAGMGQIDMHRQPLAERSGFLDVRRLVDGEPVILQALTGLMLPHMDFDPVEFLIAVSSGGIVGEPVVGHWSLSDSVVAGGSEELEVFFRSYLVKTFRLGERLHPGRYRVLVGP